MQRFSNNASTTLAAPLSDSATTMTVASDTGFAAIVSPDYELVTLGSGAVVEIVKVTAKSGATWTIARGQEGTTALAWLAGVTVEARLTAGTLDAIVAGAPGIDIAALDQAGDARGAEAVNLQSGRTSVDRVASGEYGVAIGFGAKSSGYAAVAVGYYSGALFANTTAIGNSSNANQAGAIAIGTYAQATANLAMALGSSAQASGVSTTALGRSAQATVDYATAVGHAAVATQTGSTALGDSATASGASATALGAYTDATHSNAVAVGNGSQATNSATIAIGSAAVASNVDSIAVGPAAQAAFSGSLAIGKATNAGGDNAVVIGTNAATTQAESVGIGFNSRATELSTIALGANADALGFISLAAGRSAKALGEYSSALGFGANAFASYSSVVFGFQAVPDDDWYDCAESGTAGAQAVFATPYFDLGVPPAWQAWTAYTHGKIVRPTTGGTVQYRAWCDYNDTTLMHESDASGANEPVWPGAGGSVKITGQPDGWEIGWWIGTDLAAGYATQPVPDWLDYWPSELAFICHEYSATTGTPTVSVGTASDPTLLLNAATVGITAAGQKYTFTLPNPCPRIPEGEAIVITLDGAASAGVMAGRFLFEGAFVATRGRA